MHTNTTHYHKLKHKWAKRHADLKEKLWKKHHKVLHSFVEKLHAKQHLTAGTMSALLLLTSPQIPSAFPAPKPVVQVQEVKQVDKKTVMILELAGVLPAQVRPLTNSEEKDVSSILSKSFNLKVSAELEGKRLNRSYGLIGGEQHLFRFPSDTLNKHAQTESEKKRFLPSGIAPGVGAWRYFASSESEMSQKDIEREKWYIAAPTFLAPGFNENVMEYKEWFKYRKMIVVNPKTGQAVVVDIGDAGPGASTGKHLGGSPEVMDAIGLATGPRKGAVLYYFIDDPQDIIPLGPIQTK